MADMKSNVERTKGMITLLREILIVGGILILIISPTTIKNTLTNAGIKSIAGIEFKDIEETNNETKAAINEVNSLRDSLEMLNERLSDAIDRSGDSELTIDLESIQSIINKTSQNAYKIDENLKSSLSRQEQVIKKYKLSPLIIKNIGWIFLGKVNKDQSSWDKDSPETISMVELPIQPGTLLKIKTDTYLRKDSDVSKSSAEILSVVKAGETVEITEVDFSSVRAGGWFLWAKIIR